MAKTGRKRKTASVRDGSGISRDYRDRERRDYDATVTRRAVELKSQGIDPTEAANALAGFTLGKLRLRGAHDPGGISEDQYLAGNEWARIIHRHAMVMGYEVKRSPKSPGFVMVSAGVSCTAEPSEDEIGRIRSRFTAAYDALVMACRDHGGMRLRDVTYGVCVDNWPVEELSEVDYGMLRIGLNVIGRALR
jgi:hypothetical protein